jgi:hypothetical protein
MFLIEYNTMEQKRKQLVVQDPELLPEDVPLLLDDDARKREKSDIQRHTGFLISQIFGGQSLSTH